MFQADLNDKLMEGIVSKDFKDRPCSCNARSLVNGKCIYGGNCRSCVVVYEAKCKICKCSYVVNTQQQLKQRINQHCNDVVKLVNCGERSDSFASHWGSHFEDGNHDIRASDVRELIEVEILWQGSPIKCMRSFGKKTCRLCMEEKLEILKRNKKNPALLINSKGEVYGACRHKTKFHRFEVTMNKPVSTDKGTKPERVQSTSGKSTVSSGLLRGALCKPDFEFLAMSKARAAS